MQDLVWMLAAQHLLEQQRREKLELIILFGGLVSDIVILLLYIRIFKVYLQVLLVR